MKRAWFRTAVLSAATLLTAVFAAVSLADDQAASPNDGQMKVDLVQDLPWNTSHFVMTNWFYKYKWDEPAAQIQLLAQRGYDSVMLSLKDKPDRWRMLPAYLEALDKHNMTLMGVQTRIHIDRDTYPEIIKKNLSRLRDSKALLVPTVHAKRRTKRTDPAAMARAVKILREMSDDCQQYGLGGVAIYTHIGDWVETVDDALRLAKATDRRNVGVIFHLWHFQATRSKDLQATLRRAKPYLMCVIIQGTDADRPTHKPLGQGSYDMVPLVKTLREIDYRGPVGTMGLLGGDIPAKLDAAFKAWQKIKKAAAGD